MRAYFMLVTVKPVAGAYYNIGGTHTLTIRAVLDALLALSTKKDAIKVEVDPDRLRPIDADLQVPDTTKFTRHTGWKPEIPFDQTIRDLLEYWRERVRREGDRFLQR